jgi:hypothetical protein
MVPMVDVTPPPQPQLSASPSFYNDTRAATPMGVVLAPPQPSFFSPNRDSVVSNLESNLGSSAAPSFVLQGSPLLPPGASKPESSTLSADDQHLTRGATYEKRSDKFSKWRLFLIVAIGALILILAVVLGVVFGVVLKKDRTTSSAAGSSSSQTTSAPGAEPTPEAAIVFGGDGTQVTTETGSTFTYSNKFGGYFVKDSTNPLNMGARPQANSPALNETWRWGTDKILGSVVLVLVDLFFNRHSLTSCYSVNLGGWLVIEPFITPALFQKYPTAVDEWTLSELMAADTASGGIAQLEEHYKTFVVCISAYSIFSRCSYTTRPRKTLLRSLARASTGSVCRSPTGQSRFGKESRSCPRLPGPTPSRLLSGRASMAFASVSISTLPLDRRMGMFDTLYCVCSCLIALSPQIQSQWTGRQDQSLERRNGGYNFLTSSETTSDFIAIRV